jgi:hypothetical protein
MAGMMIQKREEKEKYRSSDGVMRNGFPNRSVRRGKEEDVEDALVE